MYEICMFMQNSTPSQTGSNPKLGINGRGQFAGEGCCGQVQEMVDVERTPGVTTGKLRTQGIQISIDLRRDALVARLRIRPSWRARRGVPCKEVGAGRDDLGIFLLDREQPPKGVGDDEIDLTVYRAALPQSVASGAAQMLSPNGMVSSPS